MSSFGVTAIFSAPEAPLPSSVNSASSTDRPFASNAAVPKPLAWPSVEPGPIGLPSQEAKRRSDGVESFSAPVSFAADSRPPAPLKITAIGADFDARLDRRRAAVQESERRLGAGRERHLLAAPDAGARRPRAAGARSASRSRG